MSRLISCFPLLLLVVSLGTSQNALAQSSAECSPRQLQRLVKSEAKIAVKERRATALLNKLLVKSCSPKRMQQCAARIAKAKNTLISVQVKKSQITLARQSCEEGTSGDSLFLSGTTAGIRVGQVNFELGEAGQFFGTVNVPIPAPLSRFLRNETQYVFALEDPSAPGGLRYAQPQIKAFHHLADGAAPRIISLVVPLAGDPASEPITSRALHIVRASEVNVPTFQVTQFAQSFWERAGIRISLPGTNAGWSGEMAVRSCEPRSNGAYTRTFSCPIKLRPDARNIESGLSATVTVTFESGSSLPRLSLLLSNSSILGSFHTPVLSGSLEVVLDGQRLPIEVHNIRFPVMTTDHYRHQIVNNQYYFIPPIAGEVNAIPEDAIYVFPDAVVYGTANEQPEARRHALATRIGVVQSERASDALPIYTNWTEAALPLAAVPIASEFFSPTVLAQRAQGIRTSIFPDHTNSPGTAFGLDSVGSTFFGYLAGPNSLSMGGGVALQRINDAITLAANLREPGLRYVIEGIQAHMFAFYARWPISVLHDEQGRAMRPAAVLERAAGDSVHTGGEWRMHPSSAFNPSLTRQSNSAVQGLISEALTAPYAPVTIGYYEGTTFRSIYFGGPDRQHSIRGYVPAVISCFMIPSPQCEGMQELIGNAAVTFRIDPRNRDNLGNFYESLMRAADRDAANGVYGTILGRESTDIMYLNLRLLKSPALDEFLFVQNPGTPGAQAITLADRVKLFLSAVNSSVSGRALFAAARPLDNRSFANETQAIDFTAFSCSYYGLSECQDPYYAMTDAQARVQYCREVPDPQNPGRMMVVCEWPLPHTGPPSDSRVGLLIREGIMSQSYWEGAYTLGEIGTLASIVRDVPVLQPTVLRTITEIREHLTVFNDTCNGTNSPDRCAVNGVGEYGWIGFMGKPQNPFPPAMAHRFTSYSDNAMYYTLMSAIDLSLNFEINPANGFQTFALVFPRLVSYNQNDVFDQWRATTLGIFQQQRFSFGFPGR